MSYVALYRKARPQTFDEVCGQEQVVVPLRHQVTSGQVQHAYLFCGTRGTGKTSAAKIMARAVNCEHPVNGNPCNECPSCRAILAGSSTNVIEMDAASNNGVDNIRDVVEEVKYRPTSGLYKVYIIDEVHMLSTGAFNALLKTLEEPPAYVIFILATTDPGKIPLTILSRCQRYDFRRLGVPVIMDRMRGLMAMEGRTCEEKALHFIARSADGSMRDALSLLDRCLAFYSGQTLTYEKALAAIGAVDTDVYAAIIQAVLKGDAGAAVRTFEEVMERGREVGQFVTDFIWFLRNLLMAAAAGEDASDIIDASEEQMHQLAALSRETPAAALIRYIRVLSGLQSDLRNASARRVLTEVAIITMAKPQTEIDTAAVLDRLRQVESRLQAMEGGALPPARMGTTEPPALPAADPDDAEDLFSEAPSDAQPDDEGFLPYEDNEEPLFTEPLPSALPGAGPHAEAPVSPSDAGVPGKRALPVSMTEPKSPLPGPDAWDRVTGSLPQAVRAALFGAACSLSEDGSQLYVRLAGPHKADQDAAGLLKQMEEAMLAVCGLRTQAAYAGPGASGLEAQAVQIDLDSGVPFKIATDTE